MTLHAQEAKKRKVPETSTTKRRNLAQRLVSGAAWAFGAKIIGVSSGMVVNALLARMLPPEEMGAYFLVISVVMFAALLARFGLKQTVVLLVAESMALSKPGRARATLRIVYFIVTLGVVAVAGAYYFGFGEWLAEDVFSIPILVTVTGLTALWIAVLAFQTPVAETFRGLHDIRLAVFLDGTLAGALLASVLAVFWFNGLKVDFAQAVLVSVLMAGASLVFGTILLLKKQRVFRGDGTIKAAEVVRISSPLFVTNLAGQAMTGSSLWITGAFLTAEDVALYGAAWKLVALVSLPLLLMNSSVQPVIAQLYATKEINRLQNALRGTATLAGIPAATVLLMFIVSGESILGLLYGPHYEEAINVLIVLSLGQFANVATGSSNQILAFTGHQKQLMYVSLLTSVMSISLTVIGALKWGVLGIAAGVSLGLFVQNFSVWLLVRALTGMWSHATVNPKFILLAANKVLKRKKSEKPSNV